MAHGTRDGRTEVRGSITRSGSPSPSDAGPEPIDGHGVDAIVEGLGVGSGVQDDAGVGAYAINYANGSSRESYRIGLGANTTGISVYILGLEDKTYLARTYSASTFTGYCIKFKGLYVIDADVLHAAIHYGLTADPTGRDLGEGSGQVLLRGAEPRHPGLRGIQ